jgi:sugar porter (SP) family MFS transporter
MGIMLKKPDHVAGSAVPAILIGLFVAFGGILFGYDTGTIGGIIAMPFWKKQFSTGFTDKNGPNVTSSQSSLIVSILSAGTFFGALGAAPFGDFLGRKLGLLASILVFTFGVILQTAATHIPLFVAGRFFAGLGVGLISALIPLYQSETAPKWIRGTIVGCYQLAITIGLLLASIVNNGTHNRDNTGSYRIPIAIQFAWAIILFTGVSILPETPRYLIKKGKLEQAAKSMSRLRRLPVDDPALVDELAEVKANHEYELSIGHASYLDCFKGTILKRLITGCLLQSLQQLTGVNFIFYYGVSYFANANVGTPFINGLITNIVNVVSTFPGLYMVEKWGRRPLLLFGAIGMCICQFIVAAVGIHNVDPGVSTTTGGTVPPSTFYPSAKALIAFICFYIFFFACSWGPVAWVVTGELFPLKVRAKCLSMTTASNWLLNWAIAYMTPYLVNAGPGSADLRSKVYLIWGSCCFICIAFVYFMIYETKGLALEQVDELYAKVSSARHSKGFVPTVSFREIEEAKMSGRRGTLAEIEETTRRMSVKGGGAENNSPPATAMHTEKV